MTTIESLRWFLRRAEDSASLQRLRAESWKSLFAYALLCLAVVVSVDAYAVTASPTIQWVYLSANCPTTHVQGIKTTGNTYRCYRVSGSPTLVVPLAYNDETGIIVNVAAACPDNLSGTVFVSLTTDAGTPIGYCTDLANTLGVYVNASISYTRKPSDPTPSMWAIANVLGFMLGIGFGWKVSSRPSLELMS